MDFVTLISNVGFPIACCVALGFYILKRDSKHTEEIAELKKSVDNNTQVTKAILIYLKDHERSDKANG